MPSVMHLFTRVAAIYLCVACFGVSSFWSPSWSRYSQTQEFQGSFWDHLKFLDDYFDDSFTWPRRIREPQKYIPKSYDLNNNDEKYNSDDRQSDTKSYGNAGLDPLRPISAENCPRLPATQGKLKLSTPVECARTCKKGEPPKTCYYNFVVEFYNIAGAACQLCSPNVTDLHCNGCQCVMADGVERIALIVNRRLPGPAIEVCEGDHVVVDVINQLPGMGLTIHWHGILQKGTQFYDGVPYITQCPIPDAHSFRYQWTAKDKGTHFWHAHSGLQKMDGIYGPLIVRQTEENDVHSKLYDYDISTHVILISDWMHDGANDRFPGHLRTRRGQGPDSVLINGKGPWTDPVTGNKTDVPIEVFHVKPNTRYRFRLINSFCTVCPSQLAVEGHRLTVIAADGNPVNPTVVDSIVSVAGERYDFIINTNKEVATYWIQLLAIGPCSAQSIQQLAQLRYDNGSSIKSRVSESPTYNNSLPDGVILNPVDAICHLPRNDGICVSNLRSAVPINKDIFRRKPDVKIYLPIKFFVYNVENLFEANTYNRFFVTGAGTHITSMVGGITFELPNAPLLSQLNDVDHSRFCNKSSLPDTCVKDQPCQCIHNLNIPMNALVEVVLVDDFQAPGISHPFHLHGYHPYVIGMGRSPEQTVKRITLKHAIEWDRRNLLRRRFDLPPAKDTFPVPNNGYLIFRFHADNPGFWLFHCHFIYHQITGMEVVMHVGDERNLPAVPEGFPKCNNYMPPIHYH